MKEEETERGEEGESKTRRKAYFIPEREKRGERGKDE
jgi:hypothetical protein